MIPRAATVGGFLCGFSLGACSAPPAQMMTFEGYARVRHAAPYVLEFEDGHGSMLYFGSRHSFAMDDQAAFIERLWDDRRPDVAFNEGGDPPVAPSRDEAARRYGEAGLVRWLAARDGVPVATFEPALRDEAAHLAEAFSVEQVRLFYALRALAQEATRERADRRTPEGIVRGVFDWLDRQRAAPGEPRSIAGLEASVTRLLPDLPDWREPPIALFDPVPWTGDGEWTNRVSRRASEYRDEHIVRVLVESVRAGRRSFAVIGASHVVMQEPLLRSRFRTVRGPLPVTEGGP